EHRAIEHYLGVGGEHGSRGEIAASHLMPAHRGFGARDALDVLEGRFLLAWRLDDVAPPPGCLAQQQLFELDADLTQELLPARALGREVDRRTLGQNEQFAHGRWYG